MPIDQTFLDNLRPRPIGRDVDTSKFTCNPRIDWYVATVASDHHERRITSVMCWLHNGDLAGYITTSMTIIQLKESKLRQLLGLAGVLLKKDGKHFDRFPGLLIGMLGVCDRYKRRGLGQHMVKYAVGQARSLSNEVGCRLVTVDSDKTEEATSLYKKLGFQIPEGQDRENTVWMYYDVGPIA